MDALKARAEAGDLEAQKQLTEHKQYQVKASVKSYQKMREDALNGDPVAKERYEKRWHRDVKRIIQRKVKRLPRNQGSYHNTE